jgi:hypothetical protein
MNSRIVVGLGLVLQLVAIRDGAAQAAPAKSSAPGPASAAIGNAVVAQEQLVLDAIAQKDTVAFNKALGRDFVYVDQNGAMRWELSKTSTSLPACVLGTGWTLDNPVTSQIGEDLVVLTYSSSGNQVCDGRKAPSPVNSLSVWRRTGGRWVAVAHSETPAAPKQ